MVVQLIKGGSSHRIHQQRGSKMEIWQVGFYDWTIRDADDWQTKTRYIRMNPVRARLVEKPEEWTYSSASGQFELDPVPAQYENTFTSGAKAPILATTATRGLKPPPPEERAKEQLSATISPASRKEGKAAKA